MKRLLSIPKRLNAFLVERIDQTFNDKILSQRLRRGALWSGFGAVISRTLAIAASILVARLVGKNDFGEIGIIQSTIVMLSTFAGFGAAVMATRFVALYCRTHQQKAGSIIFLADSLTLVLSLVISLLFFIFSEPIASGALAAPALSPLLKISAILLFFNTLIGTQLGILTGFEAFPKIAWINLVTGIASVILMPLGALLYGITGAIWAMIVVAVISWILNLITLRGIYREHGIEYKFGFKKEELGLLWTFNFPSFLSSITFTSVGWVCNTMLVNATGYGEMGIINACNSWYTAILFFPTIVSGIILPVMSERIGINETGQARKIVLFSIRVNALSMMPFVALLAIFSPFFMGLYGESFRQAWLPLSITVITAWLMAIQIPVGQMLAAKSKMWLGFFMNLGWAIAFIGLNYLFLNHGAKGLVTARFIAYIIHSVWTFGWFFYAAKRWEMGNGR